MIVNKDINPVRDVYYLGAKVIELLSLEQNSTANFYDVFEKLNATEKVSINLYILTIDWLYIAGAVSGMENGRIIKCF